MTYLHGPQLWLHADWPRDLDSLVPIGLLEEENAREIRLSVLHAVQE